MNIVKNDEIFEMDEYCEKSIDFLTLCDFFSKQAKGVVACTLGKWLLLHEKSS
jgi:hypothetical protein